MRKLLLSTILLVAMVATSFAQVTQTLAMSDLSWTVAAPNISASSAGFNFLGDKKTGSTNPAFNNNGKDLRIYAKGTLMIESTVGNITKVVINLSTQGVNRWGTNSVTPGTLVNNTADATITWTGDAASFTITVAEKADLSSSTGSAGQLCISAVTITYSGEAPAVSAPTFSHASGDYIDAFDLIISGEDGASIYYTTDDTAPTSSSTAYTAPISISSSTLVRAIAVKGEDISVEAMADYAFPTEVASLADYLAFTSDDQGTFIKFSSPLTVTYRGISSSNANTVYMFVQDGDNALQIYSTGNSSFGADYENGDVIPAGAVGTVGFYNSSIQLASPVASTFGAATKGAAVEPAALTVADAKTATSAMQSQYVKLSDVTVTSTTSGTSTTYYLNSGSDQVAVYNRFAGVTVPTDTKSYDVIGLVNMNNTTPQIFPISFVESTGTGIAGVETATATIVGGFSQVEINAVDNAEVLIVNTLGQAVASKNITAGTTTIGVAPGLYIVKVGQQTTKVVVK